MKGLSLKGVLVALAIVFASSFASQEAYAQRYNYRNADRFMKNYCLGVGAQLNGLQGLVKGLADLVASLQNLGAVFAEFNINLNPQLCIPDIGFGANLSVPGIDKLAACLGNFSVQIQTPDLSGVSSCIAGLLGDVNFNINLPKFDPNSLLSCLGNMNAMIDLPGLAGVIKALAEIINSLRDLNLQIRAKLPDDLFVKINALATMCRRAGFKGY